MKKRLSRKSLKKGVLCGILLIALVGLCKKYQEVTIYNDLDVNVKDKSFEYGNSINLKKVITKANKNYTYSIVKDLDTSKVGEQQVEVKVEYKGISKVIPIQLSVVDTTAPVIEIKDETITIEEGDELSLTDNVVSVVDHQEGINYKNASDVQEGDTDYYTIETNGFNCNVPGEYSINVVALDKAGNRTDKSFKVVVKEAPPVVVQQAPVYQNNIVTNAAVNASGNDIVSIAYSFVGYPYVYGGASPSGFDCSGFVQYVYSMVGKSVSRSSSTQAYDGVGISYSEAQPGDILSWGHGGMVTHSAIYIGNGQMIHAMNSNSGVIVSPVNGWTNADVLMAVRRVA